MKIYIEALDVVHAVCIAEPQEQKNYLAIAVGRITGN
jgi:hypothetical protein